MSKRLGLATLLVAVLGACSADPLAIGTHGTTTTTTPTASTTPPSTPIPSIAPATIAPDTTPPITEPPASPPPTPVPTSPDAPTPATSPDELEVLTATGVGNPLTNPDVLQAIDELGLTTDSAGDYTYYGGETDHPFVNVENGRLVSIRVSGGGLESTSYEYAFDLPDGQSPETTADLAAAPLRAKYPDYSASTETSEEDGVQEFTLRLYAPDYYTGWKVTVTTNPEYPNLALVEYDFLRDHEDPKPVGPDAVVPRFLPTVEATLAQASLSTAYISSFSISAKTGLFNEYATLGVSLSVVLDIRDQNFATTTQAMSTLADNGWTLQDESNGRVNYTSDGRSISALNEDGIDELRTSVLLLHILGDDPIARPGGS